MSIAFEELAITSNDGDLYKTPKTIFLHFKSKMFATIDEIRERKRHPDIDAMYEYVMKFEAYNAGKNLIDTIVAELESTR